MEGRERKRRSGKRKKQEKGKNRRERNKDKNVGDMRRKERIKARKEEIKL